MQPEASQIHAQVPPPGAIPTDAFIDYFSGLMTNMASAATYDKAVLKQIVDNATMQYNAINVLLQRVKNPARFQ